MQSLPIGIQSFRRLRERGDLYVDKTELIHTLMHTGPFLFLSRPRRFGKSLLTTTLQEIYRGNRALFQGLWIEDKIDWQPRPVLLLNFNALNYRDKSLSTTLAEYMDELARDQGLTLVATDHKGKFRELLTRLAEGGKVALLIDEYDKPITDLLENEEKVQEHVDTLKNFYSVLKSAEADHLQLTLLTGVSKYGKISVFSDLNNLLDITMDRRFATLLGYTQAELEHYFAEYIDRLCATYRLNRDEMLKQVAFWYNGYSWDGVNTVYVPFSIMVFLEQQTFENHWFSTGTPTFLIKLLRKQQIPAYLLEEITADNKLLDSADVHQINTLSLLFQTGYLTVKATRPTAGGQRYTLGYPNHEVAHTFQQYLLADYLVDLPGRTADTLIFQLEDALNGQNVEKFIELLRALFGSIPYTLFLPFEAYYHSLIYLILKLVGFAIYPERLTNLGRIDATIELSDVVYILEFKMTSAAVALKQIRDKKYHQAYRSSGKTIILIGIAFDQTNRNIADWKTATIQAKA